MLATPDAGVRAARSSDASALATTQARAWRRAYAEALPELVRDLDEDELAHSWQLAVSTPPTERHHVLAAVDGSAVVGFAAFGPAGDPDLAAERDAELHALVVDPASTGAGHGSRLLTAVADIARDEGFERLVAWLGPDDEGLRGFLEPTGWASDGAVRELDLRGDGAVIVRQERLRTALR